MSIRWTRRDVLRAGTLISAAAIAGCGERAPGTISDAVSRPRRGGRLRLGIIDGNQAGNLDAHKPVGGGTIRGFALYSKLWEWSDRMQPQLALAEEAETNAHATEWTIRLRQGLEFHHGKTVSADDVIFSIRRLTDPELASPYASYVEWVDRDNLRKLDDRTVRIPIRPGRNFLTLPDAWVNFGGIVPTDYHPVTNPVGAGPYRFKSFTPGQRSVFTRFENYFKSGQPYADELEIIDFKDQHVRVAALLAGQIDMAYSLTHEQVPPLKKNSRVRLITSHTHGWSSFEMNLDRAPFNDERVRRAFRLLVDREELIERALGGNGRIANDLYSPLDGTFNHAIPQRAYDPDQARWLLKQAGHADLRIELTVGPGGVGPPPIGPAQVFARQAQRVGVDVKVTQVDAATFSGPKRNSWQISNGSQLGGEFLHTASRVDAPIAVANKTNFRDPRFGELFLAAMAEPSLDRRRPLVHEAQEIQHDRGGLIIWGFVDVVDAIAPHVQGIAPERSHFATWRFDKIWLQES